MISKTKTRELAVYKQQKACDEESVFVVEGVKMCEEVLAAKLPIKTICATNLWLSEHPHLPSDAEVIEVDDNALDRLSNLRTPNEVWMLLPRPIVQTTSKHPFLTLALDHLQDPGNMGTIIRTADWFGIRRIVCSEGTVSCYNPKVVQSTMGSLFRTEIIYTNLPSYLSECGMPVYGALLDGDNIWGDSHPLHLQPGGSVLVIGNESRGITPEVQQLVTHRVMIPNIGGTAESLNASVACAILLAELMK
ncbi:MAG: RNA methyltransferase [Bacteroidales bacterium]|nr:RNA methyltransferase [Bacteroidales bacterium]